MNAINRQKIIWQNSPERLAKIETDNNSIRKLIDKTKKKSFISKDQDFKRELTEKTSFKLDEDGNFKAKLSLFF